MDLTPLDSVQYYYNGISGINQYSVMLTDDYYSPELHTAYIAREQLVSRQTGSVILFAMLEIGRTVTITLTALVALERFLVTTVTTVATHRLPGVL